MPTPTRCPRRVPRRRPPIRKRQPKRIRAIDPHVPVRSCLGCRRHRPQSELVRVTRTVYDDAPAILAVDGPSSGRGAWLCRSDGVHSDAEFTVVEGCLDRALSHQQFSRAWRTSLGPDDVEAIRAALRRDEQPTS